MMRLLPMVGWTDSSGCFWGFMQIEVCSSMTAVAPDNADSSRSRGLHGLEARATLSVVRRLSSIDGTQTMWVMILGAILVVGLGASTVRGDEGDWPMYRYDPGRTAVSPVGLPEKMHLQWVRRLPEPSPAWSEEQYKLQFDRSYEPVVMGHQVFIGSMVRDCVTAYDTRTGEENWRFYVDGPVRFAPVASNGKVWFVSDDGRLYCLRGEDGTLVYKLILAPSGRRVMGNGRLISSWPARGGPVLYDGKIYCAAGIWPFMGIFIYAIDTETGAIEWENSGSGAVWITQQHSSPAFGGVAPQGYIAADKDRLLLTSRTTPACFNRETGEPMYYHLSDRSFGKHVGGYEASIWRDWFFNCDVLYRLRNGEGTVKMSARVMGDAIVGFEKTGGIVAYQPVEVEEKNDKGKTEVKVKARGFWRFAPKNGPDRIHMQAGKRLYVSDAKGVISAIDIPKPGGEAKISWSEQVEGRVWNMIAADERLFVITESGSLYCFASQEVEAKQYAVESADGGEITEENRQRAREVVQGLDETMRGYCVMLGLGDGGLLRALLEESRMHVIVLERNAEKVQQARMEFDKIGLYGSRVHILSGDLDSARLPQYMIRLVVAEDARDVGINRTEAAQRLYEMLRPYDGVARLFTDEDTQELLKHCFDTAQLYGARVSVNNAEVIVRRTGAPKGSADWVGQYADISNTVCSKDQLETPLGVLWFGDEAKFGDVLPRHGHGPSEQVIGGRLYIEGVGALSARDVYTGQILWKRKLSNLGTFNTYYDKTYVPDYHDLSYNQVHLPGANSRGANFFVTADRVYVIERAKCRVLDALTGEDVGMFSLPDGKHGPAEQWTYIGVYGDKLIAGADFVKYLDLLNKGSGSKEDKNEEDEDEEDEEEEEEKLKSHSEFFEQSASRRLVVMNRYSGEVLWQIEAEHGFIHNSVVAGDGKVFCLDVVPPYLKLVMGKRKIAGPEGERLMALDVENGDVAWSRKEGVFGSWLGYSQEHGMLLQGHRRSRDMVAEPGDRMAMYRADTGEPVWDRKIDYDGPCILHGDTIITQESAYDLVTGEQKKREHPLSGEPLAWAYKRNYGCNTVIASENLLTFRSAAAGFLDLECDSGTGNFGGFKSGCTPNLIVANGVLNAPEYTQTCTCSYQNQTSLAMVHTPNVEVWTFNPIDAPKQRIQRLGLNLGAPGDRTSESGTLWLDWPSVGGPGPKIEVKLQPSKPKLFRYHSLRIERGDLPWVTASGAVGLRDMRISLGGPKNAKGLYTVRLWFADMRSARDEGRKSDDAKFVFDITLQGRKVLETFDVVEQAGGRRIGIVREFRKVEIGEALTVSLKPAGEATETVLCGLELVAE